MPVVVEWSWVFGSYLVWCDDCLRSVVWNANEEEAHTIAAHHRKACNIRNGVLVEGPARGDECGPGGGGRGLGQRE